MGAESFTVLAILEARDRASEIFAKCDESLGRFSETADRAAETARGAGAAIDEALGRTVNATGRLDVADARLEVAQAKAAEAARALTDAERELISARRAAADSAAGDAAATDRLFDADARLADAQRAAATTAKELKDAEATQAAAMKAAAAAGDENAAAQLKSRSASEKSGISFGKVGKIAGVMALGLGLAAGVMVRAAGNFQDSTTHLVTDAGESARNLGMVQAGILNVSTATGQSASAITDAMYHIESGGFHGAQGLALLRIAAEGARVGGADLDTVSKSLVGTMNAYGLSSKNAAVQQRMATSMMNELIAAVGAGDMRMQDLASSLGNVVPVAASAKLTFAQVGGALATMTAQNMSAQQATQDLRHTIIALQNPNSVAAKEMTALGLSVKDVQDKLGQRGLTGTIALVAAAAKSHAGALGQTYTQALAKAMGGTVGLTTALMLSGKRMGTFQGNVASVAAEARKGGSTVDNWSRIQSTFNFKLESAKTAVENTGIAIGSALLPAATSLLQMIVSIVEPVAEWAARHKTLTEIIFGAVVAITATIAIIAGLRKAFGAVKGAIDTVKGALKAVGLISQQSAADQQAAATETAVVQEEAAAEAAAAQETAATESAAASVAASEKTSASWILSAGKTVVAWAVAGGKMIAQAAVWVAENAVKVATVVAANVAGALSTAASWIAANAAMIAGPALVVAAVVAAVVLIATHWRQVTETVRRVWHDVYTFISKIVSEVIGFVKSHWPLLLAIIAGPLGLAVLVIVKHWRTIEKWFDDGVRFVENVLSWFGSLPGKFASWIGGAASAVWNAGARVLNWFSSLPGKILNWLVGLPGQMLNIGAGIVQGIWNGISGAAGWLWNHITGWASSILSDIGNAFGIGSPSKYTTVHGQMLGEGVAVGMLKSIPRILGAVRRMTSSVLGATSGMRGGGFETGSALAAGALSAVPEGGAGSGGTVINLYVTGNTIMSNSDMDQLVDKIGKRLTTQILPSAGRKIVMRG